MPIYLCKEKGVRIMRVIQFELNPKAPQLEGKTLSLGCSYSLQSQKNVLKKAEYRMDVTKIG